MATSGDKLLIQKEEILRKFKNEAIYNEFHVLRSNVSVKKYIDNSKYVGEVFNQVRHGRGIYYYSNGAVYLGH